MSEFLLAPTLSAPRVKTPSTKRFPSWATKDARPVTGSALLSTELNGRGYNKDWIVRQLAHGDTDEIRGTYNHAAYVEQRREMMQAWADSIDAQCTCANVVSIKRA